MEVICKLSSRYCLSMDEIAFIGDDINDLEVITAVGFGAAVQDAVDIVKDQADYVTAACGGRGAVREVIDLILHARAQCEEV